MTSKLRFEQDLPALLAGTYLAGLPDYREDLVRQLAAVRQRPAWTFPGRWLPMDTVTQRVPTVPVPWRAVGLLALIALLLASLIAVYVGSGPRLPSPFGIARNGAIVSTKDGDIYARDDLHGPSRLLIGGPEQDIALGFSPLGTQLLVARAVDAGHEDLLVARANGSSLVRIGGPYEAISRADWSPDGQTIAVSHVAQGAEVVTLVRTDATGEQRLELGMAADSATWRPPIGGDLLVRGQVEGDWTLFLVRRDGTDLRPLDIPRDLLEAPYEGLSPAWSPSGAQVAFHRLVDTPGEGNGNGFRITVSDVDPAGLLTGSRTLTFDPSSDDEYEASWTPTGDRLVFTRHEADMDLLSIGSPTDPAATLDLDVVARGGYSGIAATIAPDGRSIIAHVHAAASDVILDPAGGPSTPVGFSSDEQVQIQRLSP